MKQYTRIKGLSDVRRLPRLGKIRLGIKKTSSRGKEYPAEVDYFVAPDEVKAVYGEKPSELDVMFPTEDEHAVFPQAYKWYGGGVLNCKGNGETASRRLEKLHEGDRSPLADPDGQWAQVACPCPLLEEGKCSQTASLMVLLPKVSLGGVYQIDTGSFHNIVRINSAIDYVRSVVGRFALIPLKLTRQCEDVQYEGKTNKHYLLQLILNVNLDQAAELRENVSRVLPANTKLLLPAASYEEREPLEPEPEIEQTVDPGDAYPVYPHDVWIERLTAAESVDELQRTWRDLTANGGDYRRYTGEQQTELMRAKDARKVVLQDDTANTAN